MSCMCIYLISILIFLFCAHYLCLTLIIISFILYKRVHIIAIAGKYPKLCQWGEDCQELLRSWWGLVYHYLFLSLLESFIFICFSTSSTQPLRVCHFFSLDLWVIVAQWLVALAAIQEMGPPVEGSDSTWGWSWKKKLIWPVPPVWPVPIVWLRLKLIPGKTSWESEDDQRDIDHITCSVPVGPYKYSC